MWKVTIINEICLCDVLLESAKEVFERTVFMPLYKAPEPGHKIEGVSFLGSITFKGALEGRLTIYCSLPCAQAITINMLLMDPTDEIYPEDIADTIGEVTDMVMGSVKSRVQEKIGALKVSIASVVSVRELVNSLGRASKVSMEVAIDDNYPAAFSLWYREACDASGEN